MIIDKRGIVFFIALATTTTTYDYCDAFTPLFGGGRRETSSSSSSSSSSSLRAFPSDDTEHFAVSKTTSSLSQGTNTVTTRTSTTTIAPPLMARPSTETKTNTNKLATVTIAPPVTEIEIEIETELQQSLPSVWERNKPSEIHGGSQKTWSFVQNSNMVQVHMKSDGNPMNANIELWQGPGNTPQKVTLYSEDGKARPFRSFFSTPDSTNGSSNSISIRNTASMEFPIQAVLEGGKESMDFETKNKMKRIATAASTSTFLGDNNQEKMVQGGATITERFEPNVNSVQVFVSSEGRPINCRIELISGPNNIKQVMEVYCEEGNTRPFYTIIETPGYTTGVVRIINCSTMEFPFTSIVQPWDVVSTREMNHQMNTNLGGTSSSNPFEISGYGGGGPDSTFGNTVAQLGGGINTYANNNKVAAVAAAAAAAGTSEWGRLSIPAAAAPRKMMAVLPTTTNSGNKNKMKTLLPPVEQAEKVVKIDDDTNDNNDIKENDDEGIDVDNIDIECAINEDDDDIDIECAVDIETKIEAEVERRLLQAKIMEKERIIAETEAAAKTEEETKRQASVKELRIMKEKLKERINAEAEVRFEARLMQEKQEIESKKREIERINDELEARRLAEEETAWQEMERKAAAAETAAELKRDLELELAQKEKELEAKVAEAEAKLQREQLELEEAARKESERKVSVAKSEAKLKRLYEEEKKAIRQAAFAAAEAEETEEAIRQVVEKEEGSWRDTVVPSQSLSEPEPFGQGHVETKKRSSTFVFLDIDDAFK